MANILVVATTKMGGDHICVGAIDLDNNRSIRLLKSNGWHYSQGECPFEVGDKYDLSYRDSNNRPMPHQNEDVLVLSDPSYVCTHNKSDLAKFFRDLSLSAIYDRRLTKLFIASGRMTDLFEGKLQFTNWRKGYIEEGNVPSYSTCFLLNCEADFRLERDNNGKPFYRIQLRNGDEIVIPWVGVNAPDSIIPKGRIVRFSLAHWWAPNIGDPERCYLQLSEYY